MCAAAAILLLAAVWAAARLSRIAAIGSAYKAKVLASAVFVSGRTPDSALAEDVSAEKYRILRLFRVNVDAGRRRVTCSWFGLRRRTAVFRRGLGATLIFGGGDAPDLSAAPPARPPRLQPWPQGDPEDAVAGPARLGRVLEAAFAEPDPRRQRRTRAVVVVRDGRIAAERYAGGFSAHTPLAGWSMSKSALSALVGALVGEERLSPERRELLPQWRDARRGISLDDLLRMRSGLDFSEVYSDLLSDVTRMLFACGDTAAYAAAKPLRHAPGTHWAYASGTSNIISAVMRRELERRPGAYLDLPRRALFEPVGMGTAVLEPDAAGTFVGSSFMYASARDWARLGLLYLQDGVWNGRRVLPPGWVAYSLTPTPQSGDKLYAAHWWRRLSREFGGGTDAARRIPEDAFFAMGHEGQVLSVVPSRRLVAVRLGLSVHGDAWNHAEFLTGVLDALD
ncbi:MAG: serine hydrolase [Elusimicrobia bacterium]|nr:serine hydrolase [Elusimicrobiota bacterium]